MGESFGRYTVIRQLGRGAMGVVYLASDPILNREVAVKTVDLSIDDAGEREFLRDRLLRDARAAAVLKHSNIVAVYDVFEEGPRAYVVMEYVEGENLAAVLKKNPLPSAALVLKILGQMASALDYTHSHGVIHRDIKPANVMIDSSGTAKIMDFGIARISDSRTITPTGMVMGTVEYMAPEQIMGIAIDGRADQFALAVVAYQMMTGSTLFGPNTIATLTYKIVNEAPAPPSTRNAALPRGVDAVLVKALSKNPADRFATCGDFVSALERAYNVSATAAMPAPTATLPIPVAAAAVAVATESVPTVRTVRPAPSTLISPPQPMPAQRSKLIAAAAATALVVGGGLAAIVWKPWERTPTVAETTKLPFSAAPGEAAASPTAASAPKSNTLPHDEKTAGKTAPAESQPAAANASDTAVSRAEPPLATAPKANPITEAKPDAKIPPAPPKSAPESSAPPAKIPDPVSVDEPEFVPLPPEPKGATPFSRSMQLGLEMVRSNNQPAAIAAYNKAISLRPASAEAYNGRGIVYMRLQQFDAAVRDFKMATTLQNRLVPAHTNLAMCLVHLNRDDEAFGEFQRALDLNPNVFVALNGRAGIYFRRKQYRLAIADLNRAIELNPDYAPAYGNRARAREAVGNFVGAAADRRKEAELKHRQ